MRTLILLRHGLTEGNERRLYYGFTDLPLSPAGRAQARETARARPLPPCERCYTSGLARTDETLMLLTGRAPDRAIPDLREMNFGAFEMRGYEELKDDADYLRWIGDCTGPGIVRCPGGESQREFRERALRGGKALLEEAWGSALAVIHGGVIATLMARWFPGEGRNFFEWQPGPCGGWRVTFDGTDPVGFEAI